MPVLLPVELGCTAGGRSVGGGWSSSLHALAGRIDAGRTGHRGTTSNVIVIVIIFAVFVEAVGFLAAWAVEPVFSIQLLICLTVLSLPLSEQHAPMLL